MNPPVNFNEKFSLIADFWSPRVIAEMNDYQFKLVKLLGEFVWHEHADTDEVFVVMKGLITIAFTDGEVQLGAGEMIVVPKGTRHKPSAEREAQVLLIELRNVVNTGDEERGTLTAKNDVWI